MSKNHPRSIQRRSPAPGAAPGATHSVTSLREITASMKSLILNITLYILLGKTPIKNLLERKQYKSMRSLVLIVFVCITLCKILIEKPISKENFTDQ